MRLFISAMLAASAIVSPARAADSEDEIVVTATRTAAPANRIPANLETIDADAARDRGEFTLDQALAQVAGIQAPRAGPVGQQSSIFSGGFESNHTLVLFDGVRLDDSSAPEGVFDAGQDLLGDAESIEIVQGPMSALYGSGALGGVINVLPRHGREGALNLRLEAAAATFSTALASVSADGTLRRFRYALTAESYASDGYDIVPERMAGHTGESDGADVNTLTGVFDYAPSQQWSFDLLLRQRHARADYDPGFFGNIGENPGAEIARNDTALWRGGGTWRPNDAFSVRASGGMLATDRVLADSGVSGDEYHGERRFADLETAARADAWTLLLGAQAEDERIDALSFGAPVLGEQRHWGVFAGVQGALGPFDLTAALRRDRFDGFGGATTWRAGAAYAFSGARLYAAYGTSYRAPSLYERFVPFFGAADLAAEHARSGEIGAEARVSFFGRSDGVEVGALLRRSLIGDLIGFSGFSYANVDRASIDYAEARVALHPLHWLRARIVYANTDARDAGIGQALLRRPRHAWSGELEFEHGPLSAQISWREVGARLDTVYDDAGLFSGTGQVAAYDIVRASAAWNAGDNLRFYLAADNVANRRYEPVNGFAGAPASVLLGVRLTP